MSAPTEKLAADPTEISPISESSVSQQAAVPAEQISADQALPEQPPASPSPASHEPDQRRLSPYRPDDLTVAPRAVVSCYGFFDFVFSECNILDLTEGIYDGDPSLPYEEAQRRQINYLLDEIGCGPGSRILDIGCGYGTLVEAATQRGAEAIGITISPQQVKRCRQRGLDVRLMNYRHLPDDWNGYFDGIVANGSLEHFVQPSDLEKSLADSLYRGLFTICHRLINPESPSRRFATTSIHLHGPSPRFAATELRKSPYSFRWGSPKFHYAILQRAFGGSYPELGQLAACANPCFKLVREVDGTVDYDWTTDEWFRRIYKTMRSWTRGPRMFANLTSYMLAHPRHGLAMLMALFFAESWRWQFQGDPPPMRLLRQTWQWQPRANCIANANVSRVRKPR